jgi:hypothetical protein
MCTCAMACADVRERACVRACVRLHACDHDARLIRAAVLSYARAADVKVWRSLLGSTKKKMTLSTVR